VGALSATDFAERTPTRLALLGTLPRKRERERAQRRVIIGCTYPLAAPAREKRLRIRIDRVSQISR
jgi:hypothetical protein